jgi:hypothetical protein
MLATLKRVIALGLGGLSLFVGASLAAGGIDRDLPIYGFPGGECQFTVCHPQQLRFHYVAGWLGAGLFVAGLIWVLLLLLRGGAFSRPRSAKLLGKLLIPLGLVLTLYCLWLGLAGFSFVWFGSIDRPQDQFETISGFLIPAGLICFVGGIAMWIRGALLGRRDEWRRG